MADFLIRKGTLKDLPLFFPVFERSMNELFPEYTKKTIDYFTQYRYSKEMLDYALTRDTMDLFLGMVDDHIGGFFMTGKQFGGVTMAIWIAVLPEHQNKGIASGLLKAWEEKAKDDGAHALQLWTQDRNLHFYKHRGFNYVGKFPKAWYGIDINLLYREIQDPIEEKYLERS